MPSPFPGMNPYLETPGVWDMAHSQIINEIQHHLTAQVRPRYFVRLETRIYVHEPDGNGNGYVGDADVGVRISTPPQPGPVAVASLTPPLYATLPAWYEIEKSKYLEIHDRRGNDVVAVIELLSPSNKYSGPDREQYLAKRREVLRSRAHLIELDLLRGGPRLPPMPEPDCDYCAFVSRVEERPRVGIWHWTLRDAIPLIPIPLRAPDSDAQLDLKAVIDRVYDDGGYAEDIYRTAPEPRLAPDDAAWAAQFLPASNS